VGELIASEVEVRTGRCDTFAEAVDKVGERRVQLRGLTDGLGMGLSSVGTHPWSPWQEQRIIDTPHYRQNDELLRYVVWRNNTFGLHVHVGINGADRAVRVNSAMRNFLPEAPALSAISPLDEGEAWPSWPHRLLEENFWRAIRYGLAGELIDLDRGEAIPARARLEQLVEWVQPVAEELGAASWLAIPERNAAERQIARHEE